MTVRTSIFSLIKKLNPPGYDLSSEVVRRVMSKRPDFVNNVEMASYVDEWIKKFDVQYDLIVGIPRSGLMVASLVATSLAKPLATPDEIVWTSKSITVKPVKNILVIDDCISTGKSLNTGCEKIKEQFPQAMIHRGVLFANNDNKWMVDTYCRTLHGNIFQWNMLHYKIGTVGFGLDGVLCHDCPDSDDEKKYLGMIENARPYLIPEFEIDHIITSRLEKYRPETEKWLKQHNVKYRNLIMWDPAQTREGEAVAFKCDTIRGLDLRYYFESNEKQAEEIWNSTKVICLCTDQMRLFC